MSLYIQTNVEALNAHRNLQTTSNNAAKSMERLSSGYRINTAADDAAGLAISKKLRAQISGLAQANRNTADAISLVQTAEGALNEVHSMLQRVRDLAVQYNNGTLSTSDKAAITAEVAQLSAEIGKIASNTQFNGISLLSGGGVAVDSNIFTFSGMVTLASIDTAIQNVSDARASFGAAQNRLEHTLNNLATYQENLTASESRIRDVDMASEMVNFTKLQILQQAGTSMLAQANQAPQNVLTLLR